MKTILKRTLALAAIPALSIWAGALVLVVGNPEANPEAKSMHAAVVAKVTACHEPAKSTVMASSVQLTNGELRRTELKVVPLKEPGTFAVVGAVPQGSVIDLAVTNPEYKNYRPRVLIRSDAQGVQWASAKRFFSTPPTDADLKSLLEPID
jgi:hypothetical protein